MKIVLRLIILIGLVFTINFCYQVIKKPSELFSIIGQKRFKTFRSTWQVYQDEFEENETDLISARYLAALSQVESAGNALATPNWRWRWTLDVTRIYAPASSSVGLYQYTNATFKDAKRFCIHWGKVTLKGKWYDPKACWFNGLYSRFLASDSIEMTSARLDYYVRQITRSQNKVPPSKKQYQNLASVIHLCGLKKGRIFAKDGFRLKSFQYCGTHGVQSYLNRINRLIRRL